MADTIQLNPGIANAERYEGVLDLADADTRVILEGSTDKYASTRPIGGNAGFGREHGVEMVKHGAMRGLIFVSGRSSRRSSPC